MPDLNRDRLFDDRQNPENRSNSNGNRIAERVANSRDNNGTVLNKKI